jgi:hypothetical protein
MRQRRHCHLTFANVVSVIALFVALGGTAMASVIITSNSQVAQDTISGHKPPSGDHTNLISGSVTGTDLTSSAVSGSKLAANSVSGGKVLDGSLTGADVAANTLTGANINAASLGEVPSAQIGGLGRHGIGSCDPTSPTYFDCAITTINLPTPAKVLVIGQASAYRNSGNSFGDGTCNLVTNTGTVDGTTVDFQVLADGAVPGAAAGITGVLAAGSHDFAIDCNETGGGIYYWHAAITALAISPD